MHKACILPRLAFNSIKKSAPSYLPYIFATSFAVSVFFIFSSIVSNPMIQNMPHAGYLSMLMQIGKVLLGLVLIPFCFYTNSFLMKRRRREIGLYSLLGLEKCHIGFIIAAETVMVYLASVILGIVTALVFSRLIFLLLLNITKLPIDVRFTADPSCYIGTAAFFGSVFLLNLLINLIQISKTNPVELFRSARHGEKQPKRLWPSALLGAAALGGGYYLAVNFKLDSYFLLTIFGAILLVLIGTYCLFASGMIALLRLLKKNRNFYYNKKNFVTVSGMLYRMRKNAASLSNICIFSTMVIITLVCTVSLFKGLDNIADYSYPFDVDIRFVNGQFTQREALQEEILAQAQTQNVAVSDLIGFEYMSMRLTNRGDAFVPAEDTDGYGHSYTVRVLRLSDYNRIENVQESLDDGELLFFSTGANSGYQELSLAGKTYKVKKELESLCFETKEPKAPMESYYLVVPDEKEQAYLYDTMNRTEDQWVYTVRFNLSGKQENQEQFLANISQGTAQMPGFSWFDSRIEGEQEDAAILGGLLFLGIFFGIIFMVCLIMIMYYKQLSEGFEDKTNFDVMQQVGMSQPEVKSAIRRQILTVFFLPLLMALLHTVIAIGPIETLLNTLNLFNRRLVIFSAVGVSAMFAAVYSLSYHMTAKAYYRIVHR
ncbi:ABC transporter permease [Marasmitruncus massiliensis]|uniref:ABC transporter permease n=1 Tax=Marasmitruncus massiliensis TaxID=1944642 RepID=UPI000C7D1D60|nr:ABC transporter permease [Marasmitruncus massiliensis]